MRNKNPSKSIILNIKFIFKFIISKLFFIKKTWSNFSQSANSLVPIVSFNSLLLKSLNLFELLATLVLAAIIAYQLRINKVKRKSSNSSFLVNLSSIEKKYQIIFLFFYIWT